MIREDYCSFEIAQLLKEKGFKEIVQSLWIGVDKYHYISTESIKHDDYNSCGTVYIQLQLTKWLSNG